MVGNVAKSHFICFDFKRRVIKIDVFCTLSFPFCSAGLSFALCSFGCSFRFCCSFGFWEFNKQTTTATTTSTVAVYVRYNSLFISLPFFTKQQHENKRKNVKYGGQFLELLFRILTLSYICCLEYL